MPALPVSEATGEMHAHLKGGGGEEGGDGDRHADVEGQLADVVGKVSVVHL